MFSPLVLAVRTTLDIIAKPEASNAAGAVVALKEVVGLLLAAAGIVHLASGEQLVPLIWTDCVSVADFCTVARKTRAGHAAILCAKGAIRPSVGFVGAVRAIKISVAKLFVVNASTAVPAPEGRKLIIAIMNAFFALFIFAITHLLTINFKAG